MKLSFCYREHNSTQNGIIEEKIVTSLWPVRNDIVMDFTQRTQHLFWDEEGVWQAKGAYFHQLSSNF